MFNNPSINFKVRRSKIIIFPVHAKLSNTISESVVETARPIVRTQDKFRSRGGSWVLEQSDFGKKTLKTSAKCFIKLIRYLVLSTATRNRWMDMIEING